MTSIGEPFLLSTHTFSRRKTKNVGAQNLVGNATVSYQHASSSKTDGSVTVATAGDGIQVIDLSTLHPITSHTLGPQSSFSCPPITRIVTTEKSSELTTYAILESAGDITSEEGGRTLWVWRNDHSGDSVEQKRSVVVPHRVSSVVISDELPGFVVLVGPGCEVTTLGEDLQTKWSFTLPDQGTLLKSFVFSRKNCSFVPARVSASQGAIILLLYRSADVVRVRTAGVNASGSLFIVGDRALYLDAAEILEVSCSDSGFLSVLAPSGRWYSFQLEILDSSPGTISPQADSITLHSLTFVTPLTSSETGSLPLGLPREVATLSLGSSHVLLAGVSPSPSPEVVLLLWDLQYNVLLASHVVAIPSTLPRSHGKGIEVTLVGGHPQSSQVILVLSPARNLAAHVNGAATESSEVPRDAASSILVVPVTVPPCSTLANAMGRANAGTKWIVAPTSTSTAQSHPLHLPEDLDPTQARLLRTISHALHKNNPKAADEAFLKWATYEEGLKSNRNPNKRSFIKKVEGMDEEEREWEARIPLGYYLVQTVLEMVLETDKGNKRDGGGKKVIPTVKGQQYSPRIVRYLLEKGVVCNGMVQGGLLGALKLRKDWDSVLLALRTVTDLPEADIVSFLCETTHLDSEAPHSEDAMQVDSDLNSVSASPLPSLSISLSYCIKYPTSAPSLRVALREQIKDVEALDRIFEVLLGWLEKWCGKDLKFLPEGVENNEHGIPVPVPSQGGSEEDLPPVDKILSFLQILLDTSYLTLLTHPPSYAYLNHLNSTILPCLLSLTDDLQLLSGPLQPFAQVHLKALADASRAADRAAKGKEEPVIDWRKRRKAAFEQAPVVGLYQIEELVL